MDYPQQQLHSTYGYPDSDPSFYPEGQGEYSEIPNSPLEDSNRTPDPGSLQFPGPSPHRSRRLLKTIIALVLIVLLLVAALQFVQTFRVDGSAMEPTLKAGEQVLVNRLAYLFQGPSRGDVIVFHYPLAPNREFIERVIGIPGDTVTITGGQVIVDGVLLHESYVSQLASSKNLTITLAADQFFVMGDNRPSSSDSRDWGPVPRSLIVGKAIFVFWPLNDWKGISSHSDVFKAVKQ